MHRFDASPKLLLVRGAEFDGADIDDAELDAPEAALVGRLQHKRVETGVDERAAEAAEAGRRGAAVILQFAELRIERRRVRADLVAVDAVGDLRMVRVADSDEVSA